MDKKTPEDSTVTKQTTSIYSLWVYEVCSFCLLSEELSNLTQSISSLHDYR